MTLESPRLELRAYREEDAEALCRLVDTDREVLRRSFNDTIKQLGTAMDAKAFIRDNAAQRHARKVFVYGVWTLQNRALIGQIKVKNLVWEIPSAELSYFIGSGFRRQGYATEAVLTLLHEAFERLRFNRIHARVIASNQESLELARKLGMTHEGLHRQEFRCGYGELHDVHHFSVMGDDYPGIRSRFRKP